MGGGFCPTCRPLALALLPRARGSAAASPAARRRRWSPARARSARAASSGRTVAPSEDPELAQPLQRRGNRTLTHVRLPGRSPHRTGRGGHWHSSGSRRPARGAPAARCAQRLPRGGLAGACCGRSNSAAASPLCLAAKQIRFAATIAIWPLLICRRLPFAPQMYASASCPFSRSQCGSTPASWQAASRIRSSHR
jgi:hypothetical protein